MDWWIRKALSVLDYNLAYLLYCVVSCNAVMKMLWCTTNLKIPWALPARPLQFSCCDESSAVVEFGDDGMVWLDNNSSIRLVDMRWSCQAIWNLLIFGCWRRYVYRSWLIPRVTSVLQPRALSSLITSRYKLFRSGCRFSHYY